MMKDPRPSEERIQREEDLEEGLKAIYESPEGDLPDLTKMEREGGNRITRILLRSLAALTVISALAWGGFFVWTRFQTEDTTPLSVSIDGPIVSRSGEEAVYTVRYRNEGDVPVAALALTVSLPPGFELTETLPAPTDSEGLSWTLGSLTPGSDGAVELHGRFRSAVPSTETIQARFDYKPANFSSEFQDLATLPVSIDQSSLELSVTGPEKALPGDEVTYVIEVLNTARDAQERIEVASIFPASFTFVSSDPPSTDPEHARWTYASIEPGGTRAITIKGRYTGGAEGTQRLTADVAYQAESGSSRLLLADAAAATDLLGGELEFHLVVDGSVAAQDAALGENLKVSFDYGNRGSQTMSGVSFTLAVTGTNGKPAPVDWAKVTGLPEGLTPSPTMVFNETSLPDVGTLDPNEEGVVDITLPLLATIDPTKTADELTLTLSAKLTKVGSVESPRTIPLTPVQIAIGSDLNVTAEARYYDVEGQALGSGPLPPTVGETTKYRILWKATNALHPLKGFKMTASLPPDVAWTAQTQSDGAIRFDETTRTVIWEIPTWDANRTVANASFEVGILPDAADVGSFFKLTNAIAAEATDAKNNVRLSRSRDVLTTELPTDADAKGKGVVVPK